MLHPQTMLPRLCLCREDDLTAEMVSMEKPLKILQRECVFKKVQQIVLKLCLQVLAEADLLSNFTTNVTWRGGELCEGVQVSDFKTNQCFLKCSCSLEWRWVMGITGLWYNGVSQISQLDVSQV